MATIAEVMKGGKLTDNLALCIEKVEYKRDELGPYVLISSEGKIYKTYSTSVIRQLKNIQERGFAFGPGVDRLICVVKLKEGKTGNMFFSLEDETLYE